MWTSSRSRGRRQAIEALLTVGCVIAGSVGLATPAASQQQPSDSVGDAPPSSVEDRLRLPAPGGMPEHPRSPAVVRPVDPGPIPLYDVIIEGGRVVDGTGNPWYYGDVAIRGDRITRITPPGELASAWARERVDATDRVVAPGFIDIQSHSRYALLHGDGRVISKVTQGVTTEIMGEGTTDAPLDPRGISLDEVEDPERRAQLEAFSGPHGFDAWLRAMEAHGASVNLGSFIGGTSLRIYGRGYADGPPTAAQLDTMRAVTRRAMEDGAFGVATALVYPPGSYATTEELVEIAGAMAPYGGVYITHLRSEGDRFLEALAEALEIGRRGGVPVEIYHLKAAGTENWSKAERAVAMIDSARAAGQDVQATLYPYTAASTSLSACIPPWVSEGGRLYQNLEDPQIRRRVVGEMLAGIGEWENFCRLATPEGVLLLGLQDPQNRRWSGMRLSEVVERTGRRWPDVVIDLILSERGRISTIYFLMREEDVRLFLSQPWIKMGSDAGGLNPNAGLGLIHPRAYGTFSRLLGRYVREEGVLSLEEAVRKSTSAVATRLSIPGRGFLKEGFFADVVVFDPETVDDRATFEDPHRVSTGFDHVLVNGVFVLRDGEHTGARPGRVVRGPGSRSARDAIARGGEGARPPSDR